jgi:AraC-like DNA-binding protein/mannose-6-phosphate isomerase-like protein (cupin superfamily)
MKASYEHVDLRQKNSFRVIHLKYPNACGVIWHYHPEYEIVYVVKGRGKRYIGSHTSFYEGTDLVIIGTNTPHLNFHNGINGDYEAYIIQISPDFVQKIDGFSELEPVYHFLKSILIGQLYGKNTQDEVGQLIRGFAEIPAEKQLVNLLIMLSIMTHAKDSEALDGKLQRPVPDRVTEERIKKIHDYVQTNYQTDIDIGFVSKMVNLSLPAFCRYFKTITRLTFTQFVNEFRINKAIQLLLEGAGVTEACFDSGFKSLSNFNSAFKKQTGRSPLHFKKNKSHFF